MKLKKRDPSDPEVTERVLANILAMPAEDLLEVLTFRKEGVKQTTMNETLQEYDRALKKRTGRSSAA